MLPSELLCRRPDVRQAELAMRAAGARVLASRKELFPTISLAGATENAAIPLILRGEPMDEALKHAKELLVRVQLY